VSLVSHQCLFTMMCKVLLCCKSDLQFQLALLFHKFQCSHSCCYFGDLVYKNSFHFALSSLMFLFRWQVWHPTCKKCCYKNL